jgi:hypothetical protein
MRIEVLDAHARLLGPFATGTGNPRVSFKVHGFIIPECQQTDYRYSYCINKIAYWKNHFGRDRDKNPKGIVRIHQTGDV